MPISPPGGVEGCCYAPLSLTWSVQSSTNVNTSYPASNMLNLMKPRRSMRTLSTTSSQITLTLGPSAVIVGAFSIENCNFQSLLIEGSNNLSSWTSVGTFQPDSIDSDDNRRKLIMLPTPAFNYRYARLTPTVPDSTASYYQIGAFGVWSSLITLTKNFSLPYEKTLKDNAKTIDFDNGGFEVGPPSVLGVEFSLQARMERTNLGALEEFRELANIPRNRVFLFFENEGDMTKMYHVVRTGSFRLSRTDQGTVTVSGIQFTEVA